MATVLHLVKQPPRGTELDPRDPVRIYLAGLSRTSQRTMGSKIRTVQRLLELKTLDAKDLCCVALAGRAALQDANAAPKTINTTISALKGVARAAWQIGVLTAEEYQRVKDIRSVRGSRLPSGRSLGEKELEALLEACGRDHSAAGARDAAIIALQYSLQLRRGECPSLDLADYSPANETVRVKGKGDKERMGYTVDRGAANALADWLNYRSLKPGPLLCPVTSKGKVILRRLSDQSIYNAILKRVREAGIAKLTPHDLRRSGATDLLLRGADVIVVQRILGHSSLDTTKLYDRRDDLAQRNAARLLKLPYQSNRQPELPWE